MIGARNSKSYLLQGGTAISANTDLNNMTTVGNYYCGSNSDAVTLKNTPFTHAFTLKIGLATGQSYQYQEATEYDTGRKARRVYNWSISTWSDWGYFSDDATLFTPKTISVTSNGYGDINGGFMLYGSSLLVFSFLITLTKEYIYTSSNMPILFTIDGYNAQYRCDIPCFGSYASDLPVVDLYFGKSSNAGCLNIGSGNSIQSGTTLFCSGAIIVKKS